VVTPDYQLRSDPVAHHPTGFRRSVSQKKGRNKFARYRRARFEQEGEKEITKGDERKKSNISASRNAGDRIVRVRSYPPSHITSDLYLGRSESLTDVSTVHSVLSSEYLGSVNDIDEGWDGMGKSVSPFPRISSGPCGSPPFFSFFFFPGERGVRKQEFVLNLSLSSCELSR